MFSRTLIYLLFLTMAFIFNGPIGIGTIFTVCAGGPLVHYLMPLVTKGLCILTETNTAATTSDKDKTHSRVNCYELFTTIILYSSTRYFKYTISQRTYIFSKNIYTFILIQMVFHPIIL